MTLQNRPDVISVLGMHRSGTSFLIGSLQAAGLYLGPHNTWNAHNLKGNRENNAIVELHEEILTENGGTWKAPPPEIKWRAEHTNRVREIIRVYQGHEPWGFKDPRTLLMLRHWRALLPEMQCVGVFRRPAAVARSLMSRGKGAAITVAAEQAFDLWEHYNRLLLAEHRRQAFPVLCFDWPENHLHARLDALIEYLGLAPVHGENRFFSADLRHHGEEDPISPPPSSLTLYHDLMAVCF
jgi:hypothetical protein